MGKKKRRYTKKKKRGQKKRVFLGMLLVCICGGAMKTSDIFYQGNWEFSWQEFPFYDDMQPYIEDAFTYIEDAVTYIEDVLPFDLDSLSGSENSVMVSLDSIPAYSGYAYTEINKNVPYFQEEEYTTEPFESYSDLDSLGRCGVAYANICQELMPTEERGSIGSVKPTGWHTVKYPDVISDLYLYNRCHLIGYQLAGENANEKNLITGTRYMNVEGMLPFENEVADYVEETDHHVLYRVTPIFTEDHLVADGVLMEAYSVEDAGAGVCFCVFVYNVQPGIEIDYQTGESRLAS